MLSICGAARSDFVVRWPGAHQRPCASCAWPYSPASRWNASDAQKSIDNETIIAARRRRSAAEQIWRAAAVSRFMPTSGRNVWASKSGRIPAISQANLMNQRHINRSGLQRACTLRAPCPDLWESLFSADDADIHLWNKMPSQPVPTHDPQGAV